MPSSTKIARAPRPQKAPAARLSLADAMAALEAAGSEQTRKTYARHGVTQPMFGVSFATLKTLFKRIRIDHELSLALWQTNNFDARNLAVKIVDPQRMTVGELDAWAEEPCARMCGSYVAQVAAEGPHARTCVERWLASAQENPRCVGWTLVGALAMIDETMPEAWFAQRLQEIEHSIHAVSDDQRDVMNKTLIAIGCRSAALREAATAAAHRIGKVKVDYGETACKTPEAQTHIAKAWSHADAKGFDSPAAQERGRESLRTRC